jgi:hypothetical protein
MNYEDWEFEKWNTKLSDSNFLFLESLVDKNSELILKFSDSEKVYELTFRNYSAYRNILEQYRTKLWTKLHNSGLKDLGNSWIIENSDWMKNLFENEPLLELFESKLKHYLITTEIDVIEVLSSDNPDVKILKEKPNGFIKVDKRKNN